MAINTGWHTIGLLYILEGTHTQEYHRPIRIPCKGWYLLGSRRSPRLKESIQPGDGISPVS